MVQINSEVTLKSKKKESSYKTFLSEYGIIFVLVILFAFFSLTAPSFLTIDNVFNILRQVSIVGIAAVGMTFVMLTSGIDLSIGSIMAVSGVIAAKIMLIYKFSPLLTCIIVLLLCILIGLFNGFLVNELSIPPLISTLATMTSLRGLAYIITGGLPVFGFDRSFSKLGQGYMWFIPIPVIIMTIIFILGILYLDKTIQGRYIYGVGGNEEATRLSGINIKKVKYLVYTLCSLLSGIAGIILLSRTNSGQPSAGVGYEMDVITAVVLGGVSMKGGEGKLSFVVIGVLIMGILTNGMIMLNINDYVQQLVKGLVLITAVGFDMFTQKRKINK